MNSALLSQIILAFATLLASLGGYVFAGINERRRDERTLEGEMAMRRRDLLAKLESEKHALQLESLMALQDALQRVARLTGKTMYFDHMQARDEKYTQLPEGLSEEMLQAEVSASRYAERVLDPQVRSAVRRFMDLSKRLSMLPTDLQGLSGEALENHANEKLREFGHGYNSMAELLGEALRREIDWQPDGVGADSQKNLG